MAIIRANTPYRHQRAWLIARPLALLVLAVTLAAALAPIAARLERHTSNMRAVAIDGAIVGALTWVALLVVGLEYAMPLALVAALGELVPYLGPVFAAIPALAIALANSPGQAASVAAVYLVLQQVESHVITPHVMHGQTDVPPALVVFALAAGFAAGGVLGALAAIPLAAAGRVLVLRVMAPAVRHAGRGFEYGRHHRA